MNATGGIATFNNLVINAAGGPYTLTAGSNGLTSGISTGITISAGTATSWSYEPTAFKRHGGDRPSARPSRSRTLTAIRLLPPTLR